MLTQAVAGLVAAASCGWGVYRIARPARAIWNGDESRLPWLFRYQPTARSYAAFLLSAVPLSSGTALLGFAMLVDAVTGSRTAALVVATPAALLIFGGVALIPVTACVSAFNRPRFLVPRCYRNQSGALAAAWRRRFWNRTR